MFIQYNDLIDDTKLPPKAYYTEPRDSEKIFVQSGDSIDKFIERVKKSRDSKGFPSLVSEEMRLLVVSSLERSLTNRLDVKTYFKPTAILPQYSQVAQLAKTLAMQVGRTVANYNTRQIRSKLCAKCPIHKPYNGVSKFANVAVRSAINLVSRGSSDSLSELQFSQLEQSLGSCGMCGCKLANKVRVDTLSAVSSLTPLQIDTLLRIVGHDAFSTCWILSEAIQDSSVRRVLDAKLARTSNGVGTQFLKTYLKEKHLKATKK